MNNLQNNNSAETQTSILRQLAALQTLSLPELHEKWRDLYGTEPPKYRKQFLLKRLAYRIQEIYHGGVSAQTRQYLTAMAQKDPQATLQAKPDKSKKDDIILPGTRFIRTWHDQRYEVITRENGFEYEGQIFRSLTAVATEITGTKWNGKIFFGLKKPYKKRKGVQHA